MQVNAKHVLESSLPLELLPGPNLEAEAASEQINKFIKGMVTSKSHQDEIARCGTGVCLPLHKCTPISRKKRAEIQRFTKRMQIENKWHVRKIVSRKNRKSMGLVKLPRTGWSYEALQPLRDTWLEYIDQVLQGRKEAPTCIDPNWEAFGAVLAKAEYVGANVTVVRSKSPSYVGIGGTIVLETKCSFQVVTEDSQLKILLKEPSVFCIKLDHLKLTFFGKHLLTRSTDKSVRKIKTIMKPDL